MTLTSIITQPSSIQTYSGIRSFTQLLIICGLGATRARTSFLKSAFVEQAFPRLSDHRADTVRRWGAGADFPVSRAGVDGSRWKFIQKGWEKAKCVIWGA